MKEKRFARVETKTLTKDQILAELARNDEPPCTVEQTCWNFYIVHLVAGVVERLQVYHTHDAEELDHASRFGRASWSGPTTVRALEVVTDVKTLRQMVIKLDAVVAECVYVGDRNHG
jgi:hypothetical protein